MTEQAVIKVTQVFRDLRDRWRRHMHFDTDFFGGGVNRHGLLGEAKLTQGLYAAYRIVIYLLKAINLGCRFKNIAVDMHERIGRIKKFSAHEQPAAAAKCAPKLRLQVDAVVFTVFEQQVTGASDGKNESQRPGK